MTGDKTQFQGRDGDIYARGILAGHFNAAQLQIEMLRNYFAPGATSNEDKEIVGALYFIEQELARMVKHFQHIGNVRPKVEPPGVN